MAMTAEYLIRFIVDKAGITEAQASTAKFQKSIKGVGLETAKATQILGTKTISALNKQGQTIKSTVLEWKDLNGQIHRTTVIGGKEARISRDVTGSLVTQSKTTSSLAAQYSKLALRAAMVVPIWFALRRVFTGFLQTIRLMVSEFVKLDDAMARIRTVTHGTAESINTDMGNIREYILSIAKDTRAPMEQLTESFYFLKTSNLETEEAMAAFIPTVNAMVGTMGNAQQLARAVAGIYNTMGQTLGDNLTITEKFTKIADILTYTYSTQDTQIDELVQSYAKLAPYLTSFSDSFEDMITMLGFFNTRLLRAGRAGRLTGRSFLQILKNVEKLAGTLGITFEPNKPLNYLKTIEQIRDALGTTTELTARQAQIIQEVFATRGAVPINIILKHFDDLTDAIKKARTESEGFAKKMAEIRMDTIAGQVNRLKNNIVLLGESFITGVTGGDDLVENLKKINERLIAVGLSARVVGSDIGVFIHNLTVGFKNLRDFGLGKFKLEEELVNVGKEIDELIAKRKTIVESLLAGGKASGGDIARHPVVQNLNKQIDALIGKSDELVEKIADLSFRNFNEEVRKAIENFKKSYDEVSDSYEKRLKNEIEVLHKEELRRQFLQEEKEDIDFIAQKMKLQSYTEEEIAKFRLERLEALRKEGYLLDDELDILKAQHDVALATMERVYEYGNIIRNTFEESLASLLKGEATIGDVISNIQNKILSTLAETQAKAITTAIFRKFPIDKIFGGALTSIEDIFKSPGEKLEAGVARGSAEGSVLLEQGVVRGAITASQIISQGFSTGGSLGGRLGSGNFAPLAEMMSRSGKKGLTDKELKAAQKRAGMLQTAMGIYQLSQMHRMRGQGLGAAISGATAGYTAGMGLAALGVGGPIGWIAAGIGAAVGMIQGGKSKTIEEVQNQTFQVASRIDNTNRKLDVINRNLIAQTSVLVNSFILRESAYFAERRGNLEDEFSLHNLMGVSG